MSGLKIYWKTDKIAGTLFRIIIKDLVICSCCRGVISNKRRTKRVIQRLLRSGNILIRKETESRINDTREILENHWTKEQIIISTTSLTSLIKWVEDGNLYYPETKEILIRELEGYDRS